MHYPEPRHQALCVFFRFVFKGPLRLPTMTSNTETTTTKFCCIVCLTLKRNNVHFNVTNLKGQTITKFSSGLIQKRKNKKRLKSVVRLISEKVSFFVKSNFQCARVTIKGRAPRPISYLKQFLRSARRRQIPIVRLHSRIPIVHNGCRPPKRRRI